MKRTQPLLIAAIVAAVSATTASTAPTGVDALDACYRALFAVVLTSLSFRAHPLGLVVAAGVAIAGTSHGVPVSLAAIALGAALVATFGSLHVHSQHMVRLVSGVALAQALLRLGAIGDGNRTAWIGLAATLVVAASSIRRSRRERQIAFVVTGLLAIAVPAALFIWQREQRLVSQATTALESGINAARTGDTGAARAELDKATSAMSGLQRDLSAWWIRPARVVPGIAQQLVAARALVAAGADLSTTANELAAQVDLSSVKFESGRVDLVALAALREPLDRASQSLDTARARTRQVDKRWLLPAVRSSFDDFETRTQKAATGARRARDAVEFAPELLGANGVRRYFLALQTNAEMRGTGGVVGNYGVLTTNNGAIELSRFGRIDELNPEFRNTPPLNVVGPADYIGRYRDSFTLSKYWQNVTASPDFPSVGQVIIGLAPQSGLGKLDGAIAIDPYGLAALLRATGPVTVPDWPDPITADNAAEILLYRQYVEFGDDEKEARVEFLASTSQAVFDKLTSGAFTGVSAIVDALGPAVRSKHVQLYATDPGSQAMFVRAGVAGAVAPVDGDHLGVVTQDGTPSKLDWFQRRSVTYEAVVDPRTRQVDSTATITLRNLAPTSGLPYLAYGAGYHGTPANTTRTYVSIYSPLVLAEAAVDEQPVTMESANELGRFVYSTFVTIPPGGSTTIRLKLVGELNRRNDYRLLLSRQPAVAKDEIALRITEKGAKRPTLAERLELDSDTIRTVRMSP